MTCDASSAASSPMTNGTLGHREAGASTTESQTSSVPSLRETCADLHRRVQSFLSAEPEDEDTRQTQRQTRVSIDVIEQALQDYGFDGLSISYNGGKDCLVLLILYLSALHSHFSRSKSSQPAPTRSSDNVDADFPTTIPSIYAEAPDPFPQVTSFVESSSKTYHLDLVHILTNTGPRGHVKPPSQNQQSDPATTKHEHMNDEHVVSFPDAFALYLSSRPQTRAIFVGTRRTDPHGAHLTHFDMTDGNWPRFMRVHPVIDWHLSEVWCFLRSPHLRDPRSGQLLEYCSMYDEGYTSLGGVGDTLRNPKLKYTDDSGGEKFHPAYKMTEDLEERLGRE